MRRSSRSRRRWLAATALGSLATVSVLLVLAAAKPTADPPIELSFRDSPLFLGPHEHWVTAVAFSPDGQTLATGDGCLRFWDVATGRLKSIQADDAMRGINGLAYAPDGRVVAAVGALFGREALLWDTTSGKLERQILESAPSPGSVAPEANFIYKGQAINYRVQSAVAYSPDGRLLATAPAGVVLRDAQSGEVVTTLNGPVRGVTALVFSVDGKTLATAADDKQVRLWAVPEGKLAATFAGATQPLTSVALADDGQLVAAVSTGKRSLFDETPVSYLWTWQRAGGAPRKIELGSVRASQVAFVSPTEVVVGAGRELLLFDLRSDSSSAPRRLWSHSQDVHAVAVSPDRRLVATGSRDRTVDIIDVASGKLLRRLPGLNDVVSSVATARSGQQFATASMDVRFTNRVPDGDESFAARHAHSFDGESNSGRIQPSDVRIWSSIDGRQQALLPLAACQVTAVTFVPNSDLLAIAGWLPGKGGMLSLWNAQSHKHLVDLPVGETEVLTLATSFDGRWLASGDANGNLDIWEVATRVKARSQHLDNAIEAIAFSADGKLVAAADSQQAVRLFDANGLKLQRTLKCQSFVEALEFSPDGSLLAAGTRHPGLELWDLRTSQSRVLKASGDHFATMPGFVAFSPDGRYVVCGGHGKDIAVFDVAKGTLHCELRGHFHPATSVAFLPDGRLISGGEERTIRLWSLNPGEQLAMWLAMPADDAQGWSDQWIGYKPSGEFVGPERLDRLVGWLTGGETLLGAEIDGRRARVESLFASTPASSQAR
ncbi:MAG: WD40 repeat domain-containing protein [Pirellulales bacterium]|nr:WD40 repeat domain-containing protein [Pirellulales bacterium]